NDRVAVLYTCDDSACAAWANLIRRELAPIGITVKTRTFPTSTLQTKTATRGAKLDLALRGRRAGYSDPSDFLNVLLDGRSIRAPDSVHVACFPDTAVERRLDTAERLFGAARMRAYSRLEHDIATRAAPWAPLATLEWDSLFSERVGCQVLHPIY